MVSLHNNINKNSPEREDGGSDDDNAISSVTPRYRFRGAVSNSVQKFVCLFVYFAVVGDLTAPDSFSVLFTTTVNNGANFTVEVQRAWAPNGVDHFYTLLQPGTYYYDGDGFFRVIVDFVAQWGINGDPAVSAEWNVPIPDDPVIKSNLRGWMSYAATSEPNSRTTQVFINYVNNSYLDASGFAPFGQVVDGMEVVDQIYSGYAGTPKQPLIMRDGNEYLETNFPLLDYVKTARIISV